VARLQKIYVPKKNVIKKGRGRRGVFEEKTPPSGTKNMSREGVLFGGEKNLRKSSPIQWGYAAEKDKEKASTV